MPDRLEAASPAVPGNPPSETRAARLKGFERERLIVDYLNRGVSVSEIAAHVGVGEKRMRAIIREILARRMPAPPQEFVAIQVSRLNEALLVAYSAMSPTNLRAVDRVVKIVRELERYHGFNAAERRLPEASGLEADADGDRALEALFDSPENPSQEAEILDSAPGNGAPSQTMREEDREAARDATPFLETPLQGALGPEESMERGPENSAQELGNIDSTPGCDARSSTSMENANAAGSEDTRLGTVPLRSEESDAGPIVPVERRRSEGDQAKPDSEDETIRWQLRWSGKFATRG